jgi:DivIVA domain-containing protein
MKITHQDILDKEFRVKFRGFDMAEVDTFLEEVAESFFKITEENSLLNENVLALQEEIESVDRMASRGQIELPAEMLNFLEELKQDTAAINAEIVSLKQDRSILASLDKSIKEAVAALQKAAATPPSQAQTESSADLSSTLEKLTMNSEAIAAEMVSLKEDRQSIDSLQKSLEEVISTVQKTASATTPQVSTGSENLAETLDEFRKSTETMSGELAALKQEVGSMQQIREEIKSELQELLTSHFNDLSAKLSKASPEAAPGKKEGALAAAIIEEEPPEAKEDTGLPGFEEEDETYDDDLEFLSEDDILDVDKLRSVFQSVLDSSVSDTPNSREYDDDSSSDLLFLEDILEDEHEPEVSFSLEEGNGGKKPKTEAEA